MRFKKSALVKAYDGVCQYCGGHGDQHDHIIPKHLGGDDGAENAMLSCRSCNSKKGAKRLPAEKEQKYISMASENVAAIGRLSSFRPMMSKDEYRAAITQLGLAQEEVGKLLGVGGRTARRWASGEAHVPGPVEMHIRLWLERPELLSVVRKIKKA